jgi:hypothetical protein
MSYLSICNSTFLLLHICKTVGRLRLHYRYPTDAERKMENMAEIEEDDYGRPILKDTDTFGEMVMKRIPESLSLAQLSRNADIDYAYFHGIIRGRRGNRPLRPSIEMAQKIIAAMQNERAWITPHDELMMLNAVVDLPEGYQLSREDEVNNQQQDDFENPSLVFAYDLAPQYLKKAFRTFQEVVVDYWKNEWTQHNRYPLQLMQEMPEEVLDPDLIIRNAKLSTNTDISIDEAAAAERNRVNINLFRILENFMGPSGRPKYSVVISERIQSTEINKDAVKDEFDDPFADKPPVSEKPPAARPPARRVIATPLAQKPASPSPPASKYKAPVEEEEFDDPFADN